MSDLQKLIERLSSSKKPDRLTDANIQWAVDPQAFHMDAGDDQDHLKPTYCYARGGWTMNKADHHHLDMIGVPRFTASVDAALALAENLLPAEPVLLGMRQSPETLPWARIGKWARPDAAGATLAIAICLAVVYAKAASGNGGTP